MTLYEVKIINHGSEEYKHAIVRAKSSERALEMVEQAGFVVYGDGYPRPLDKYNKVNEEIVTIL